jgi:outer membrane cobalamin receptor
MSAFLKNRLSFCILALAFCLGTLPVVGALAETPSAHTIAGTITSDDGTPLGGAVVHVYGPYGDRSVLTTPDGRFEIDNLGYGEYSLDVRAPGYDRLTGRSVGIHGHENPPLVLSLSRSQSSLITIGRTRTAGNTLSTSTVPTTTIDAQAYAGLGVTRVSDVLQDDISTTLFHVLDAGSTVLPTSVALRGPDPTETLVDVDGFQINSGNTGDFDLSLLDPADYESIELVKGISPSSLIAPDTIDGAVNIRTIEPTQSEHALVRFFGGSYNSFGETIQTTGTVDKVGYVLSLHRTTSDGEVYGPVFDAAASTPAQVGSAFDGSNLLAKLRYSFGRTGDAYVEGSFRDQSQFRDLSAGLSVIEPPGVDAGPGSTTLPNVDGAEGSLLAAHVAGYGVDLHVPFGNPGSDGIRPYSVLYRHYSSLVSQSVFGPAEDSSPYLYNDRDLIDHETLELDRQFSHASLTLHYDNSTESLATDFVSGVVNSESVARAPGALANARLADTTTATNDPNLFVLGLGQTQRFFALRYTYDPTSQLHLTAAGYYSRYSLFGSSIDPRFGASFTPDVRDVVRFSIGTTYQVPQLPELYTAPASSDLVGQPTFVGNPNLQPDRATEYGLGFEHLFDVGARQTSASLDLYRVNIRNPATATVPATVTDPNCGPVAAGGDGTLCPTSTTINAGDGVYQGFELQAQRMIAPFTALRAGYAVRSAYVTAVPAVIQDGTLVSGEQDLGLPLQKGTLGIAHAPPSGFTYGASAVYEGLYNELDQPQFATVDASLGYRFKSLELEISGTNLTDVYDQRFTHIGTGLVYGGVGQTIATDALALQGTAFHFSITRRF